MATLTGGIVTTFGPVHAGLMGTDDAWCDAIAAAGEATGERVWRLPLDPLYDEMIKGSYGDIMNAVEGRKAHSITAAAFLARFAGDVPWAHLDIAGRERRPRPGLRGQGRVRLGRPPARRAGPRPGVRTRGRSSRSPSQPVHRRSVGAGRLGRHGPGRRSSCSRCSPPGAAAAMTLLLRWRPARAVCWRAPRHRRPRRPPQGPSPWCPTARRRAGAWGTRTSTRSPRRTSPSPAASS